MNILKFIAFVTIIMLLSSCGLTYSVLLGIDTTPDWVTDEQIAKQAKKYKIPAEYNLLLDTASYKRKLKHIYAEAYNDLKINQSDSSHFASLKKARSDDFQPAQFRLFDQMGVEIFKLVNCYIDPPIPLRWNVDGCFNSFPPKTSFQALDIHMFPLEFLLSHTTTLDGQPFAYTGLPEADYYGVILWNDYFKRPSRRLVKTVQEYVEKTDQTISLIYINNHNQMLWSVMDSEDKEKVKTSLSD
jgi:hypothetical protein